MARINNFYVSRCARYFLLPDASQVFSPPACVGGFFYGRLMIVNKSQALGVELIFSCCGVRVSFFEWLMYLPWIYKFLRWLRSVDERIIDKIMAPIYYPHGRDAEGNAISPDD